MARPKRDAMRSELSPAVRVEYDYGTKGERRTRTFEDHGKAKKFVAAKERAGKNPVVQEARRDTPTMSSDVTQTQGAEQGTVAQKERVPGVRPMRTRTYLAGAIIAKHGLGAGVTDGMVTELDTAYGKPNPAESRFCLKNAWHACRAFTGIAEDAAS